MRYLLTLAAFLGFSAAANAGLQDEFDKAMANYKIRVEVAYSEYQTEAAMIEARLMARIHQIDHDKFEKDADYGNAEYVKAQEVRTAELAQAQTSYDGKVAVARDQYTQEANTACRKYTGSNCRW